MNYKKVFTRSRFHTKAPNTFQVDNKRKRINVGSRSSASCNAFIGKVIEQGKTTTMLDYSVYCDTSFPHVIGVFGNRGSGKSFDLAVFLEEICNPKFRQEVNDDLTLNDAAVVFDVQDQFWTLGFSPDPIQTLDVPQLIELSAWGLDSRSLSDLKLLVPASSDTQIPNARPFSLAAAQVNEADYLAILELERFSAMGQALLNLLESEVDRTPDQLARACKHQGSLTRYQLGTIEALRWRLESLAKTGVISHQGVNVEDLLEPGRVSIILMRNLADSIRALIVGVIARLITDKMGRIQQWRKVSRRTGDNNQQEDNNTVKRLWMVLDEAHVLVPSTGATAATAPMIDYVKRGRDSGLSLIFATQQPSAVDSKLMSQVDITLTHMLGFEADLTAAVGRMPTRSNVDYDVDNVRAGSISDIIRSLAPGEAVLADGASGRICLIKVRPRCTAHGGESPI